MRPQLVPVPARNPNASPIDQKLIANIIAGSDNRNFPKKRFLCRIGAATRNKKTNGRKIEPAV